MFGFGQVGVGVPVQAPCSCRVFGLAFELGSAFVAKLGIRVPAELVVLGCELEFVFRFVQPHCSA